MPKFICESPRHLKVACIVIGWAMQRLNLSLRELPYILGVFISLHGTTHELPSGGARLFPKPAHQGIDVPGVRSTELLTTSQRLAL